MNYFFINVIIRSWYTVSPICIGLWRMVELDVSVDNRGINLLYRLTNSKVHGHGL